MGTVSNGTVPSSACVMRPELPSVGSVQCLKSRAYCLLRSGTSDREEVVPVLHNSLLCCWNNEEATSDVSATLYGDSNAREMAAPLLEVGNILRVTTSFNLQQSWFLALPQNPAKYVSANKFVLRTDAPAKQTQHADLTHGPCGRVLQLVLCP
ncbi:hypothetical protein NDU88_008157 [Pleurodeles waltl]|uniref:Uncharacterized protein n=1 Tax=Pleurodeles waltl TaxID=8319 RepID=A0AAV7RS65_PLEWA|nr:hypothetical protein NDU88_008157 [Pleurodeles waltl]